MRILLIEDDIDLCEAVTLCLKKEHFNVDFCSNGNDALFYALDNVYDVIVLDRMLPGMDGMSILKIIRQNKNYTPVIMATALGEIQDRIHGLDTGADDYIIKPYDVAELSARIRALCRRPARMEATAGLNFLDLCLLEEQGKLVCHDKSLSLSKKETDLISYFMKNPHQTLPRPLLLSYVWGADSEVEEGNLDNYIHFLRKRLRTLKSLAQIRTVHGIGYCLEKKEDAP